jgi:hypothetical protein
MEEDDGIGPDELPNPWDMSRQQRIDSLVQSTAEDDLLMVLLVLHCGEEGESNSKGASPVLHLLFRNFSPRSNRRREMKLFLLPLAPADVPMIFLQPPARATTPLSKRRSFFQRRNLPFATSSSRSSSMPAQTLLQPSHSHRRAVLSRCRRC